MPVLPAMHEAVVPIMLLQRRAQQQKTHTGAWDKFTHITDNI